jgi:hypothetical protein
MLTIGPVKDGWRETNILYRQLREFVFWTHAAYSVQFIDDRGIPAFASSWEELALCARLFQTAAMGECGIKAAHELQCAFGSSVAALSGSRRRYLGV